MAYAHGKDGKVEIKGHDAGSSAGSLTTLCVKKWEADLTKTEHDTSDTCNSEWTKAQVGKKTVTYTIEAQLDLANSPIGSTMAVVSADYASVKLYADGGTTASFDMADSIVSSVKITSDQGEIITFSISGKSSGSVTVAGVS